MLKRVTNPEKCWRFTLSDDLDDKVGYLFNCLLSGSNRGDAGSVFITL